MKKTDYGTYQIDLVRYFTPGMAELEQHLEELDETIDRLEWRDDVSEDNEQLREFKAERRKVRTRRNELHEQEAVFGLVDSFKVLERTLESDQIDIEVPEDMFATEPPRWMIWLGTRYKWPRKAQDQCDLRRRALFTGITLPLLAVIAIRSGRSVSSASFSGS